MRSLIREMMTMIKPSIPQALELVGVTVVAMAASLVYEPVGFVLVGLYLIVLANSPPGAAA